VYWWSDPKLNNQVINQTLPKIKESLMFPYQYPKNSLIIAILKIKGKFNKMEMFDKNILFLVFCKKTLALCSLSND